MQNIYILEPAGGEARQDITVTKGNIRQFFGGQLSIPEQDTCTSVAGLLLGRTEWKNINLAN
jgi:hypothetical protein